MEESEQIPVTKDQILETEKFWESPEKIMALIDLLFLWEDSEKKPRICS